LGASRVIVTSCTWLSESPALVIRTNRARFCSSAIVVDPV